MGEMAELSITDDDWEDYRLPRRGRCRYCGHRGEWVKVASGWRMADDNGSLHSCEEYRVAHPPPEVPERVEVSHDEALALLAEFTPASPWYRTDGMGFIACAFCDTISNDHKPDCRWVKARKALGLVIGVKHVDHWTRG
jgi:hypothetical protein